MNDVASSPLSVALKDRLISAGFTKSATLRGLKVLQLSKELRCTPEEAASIKKELDAAFGWNTLKGTASSVLTGQTALDIYRKQGHRYIVTFSQELDALLGGGVALGEVTEFCGVPGVGKTQLCMQLCLDVQMPAVVGGVAGSAVYIDTEGSLMPPRLEQMAAAVARHLYILRTRGRYAAPRDGSGSSGAADPGKVLDGISAKSLLEAIHVFRCTTMEEQMGTVFGLLPFLEAHPQVRLVVLDSVAFHARYSLDTLDLATRARHLQALSQALHRMAAHYDVAVVVINQMTTKFGGEREGGGTGGGGGSAGGGGQSKDAHEEEESGGGGGGGGGAGGGDDSSRLVPALGDTWAHACTSRILLQWVDGKRTAVLIKSPSQKPGVATFGVFADGVRGPHYKPSKSSSTSSSSTGGTVASHTASAAPATPAPAVTPAPLLAPAPAPVPASASAAAVAQPAPTRPVYSIPLSDLKPIPGVTNVIISSGPSASAPAPASTAAVAAALSGVKRNAAEAQLPQPARR